MKSSIAIIVLLFVNTTALLSEPISALFKDINLWILLALEVILVLAYFINGILKDLNKTINPNFNINFYKKKSS